jgi:hypothetical protein
MSSPKRSNSTYSYLSDSKTETSSLSSSSTASFVKPEAQPASSSTALKTRAQQGWNSFKKAVKEHHDSVNAAYAIYYGDERVKRLVLANQERRHG